MCLPEVLSARDRLGMLPTLHDLLAAARLFDVAYVLDVTFAHKSVGELQYPSEVSKMALVVRRIPV